MKTTVVLLRHGQSIGNLYHVFLGHSDLSLSPLGEKQAALCAAYLSKFRFDAIYTSDLCRAAETARPTAEEQGLSLIPCEELREIYAGKWENRRFEELAETYKKSYKTWLTDIGMACPDGGESVLALAKRIYRAFDRIVSENEGKTVLIATHATPIRLLKCRFIGRSPEMASTVSWVPNASVSVVEVENGGYTILEDGYDGFLETERSVFPSNV